MYFVLGYLFIAICSSSSESRRISGGSEAFPHSFPFIASLQDKRFANTHYCAGSILDKKHILTSGNCCQKVAVEYIRVALGEHDLYTNDHEQYSAVTQLYIHENYEPTSLKNDICILRLERSIIFNKYVRQTKLPNVGLAFEDGGGMSIGWGSESLNTSPSHVLQFLNMEIWRNEKCEKLYGDNFNAKSMMCAKSKKGSGFCFGDSGGPFICKDSYQCGIISWNIKCDQSHYPGVFTRVENYLSWIQDSVNKNAL